MYGTWTKRFCALAGVFLSLILCTAAAGAADMETVRNLIPSGHTIGIKLFSRGVMVVKLTDGSTPARECGLQTGDVILACDGTPVTSAEQFQSLLQDDDSADLEIRRGGGELTLSVEPERNADGVCTIGAWIRDSMAGIGTMTWYDPDSGVFGALGHGVTDVDTALLMPFQDGAILPSSVKAVKKGEKGSAGELRGEFDLGGDLGRLYANTERGVFGVPGSDFPEISADAVPAGTPVKGEARILANVEQDSVREYAIEIEKVIPGAPDGRELVIHVTDPDLLETTGGIVQGMSGSPVLQDGCLVGAVTHVLLQDPSRGYGISIASMLDAA